MKCLLIPESTLLSQNIPPFKHLCEALPESTPSQNIPPFKHLYVTLSDCTPPSQNIHPPPLLNILDHMRPSQNIPAFYIKQPPSILKHLCDPPRIHPLLLWIYPSPFKHLYATHPESTLPSQNRYPFFGNYMRHSHNLPLPSRIYPPPHFLQSSIYVTLPESILPSQNLPRPPEYTPLLDMQPS